ncbi:MAG: hypothetical protein Q7T20_12295 [Saprospiraceae bacterium]|nr:hypothetical protein [Saprospiraceae bacterium]
MNAKTVHPPLTNLQVELLKLFSRELPESDLIAIRDMIANYLLEKAFLEADNAWESKGYTPKSFQEAVNESR